MAQPAYSEFVEPLAQKDRRIAELEAQVVQLESRLAAQDRRPAVLEKLLEQRTRDGQPQAAPFSPAPPKVDPKPPGRKPGAD